MRLEATGGRVARAPATSHHREHSCYSARRQAQVTVALSATRILLALLLATPALALPGAQADGAHQSLCLEQYESASATSCPSDAETDCSTALPTLPNDSRNGQSSPYVPQRFLFRHTPVNRASYVAEVGSEGYNWAWGYIMIFPDGPDCHTRDGTDQLCQSDFRPWIPGHCDLPPATSYLVLVVVEGGGSWHLTLTGMEGAIGIDLPVKVPPASQTVPIPAVGTPSCSVDSCHAPTTTPSVTTDKIPIGYDYQGRCTIPACVTIDRYEWVPSQTIAPLCTYLPSALCAPSNEIVPAGSVTLATTGFDGGITMDPNERVSRQNITEGPVNVVICDEAAPCPAPAPQLALEGNATVTVTANGQTYAWTVESPE